jgi:hypothetical protein
MKTEQVMGLNGQNAEDKRHWSNKKPTNTKTLKKYIDHEYYREEEWQYLTTILTEDNDVTTEIRQRKIIANKTS